MAAQIAEGMSVCTMEILWKQSENWRQKLGLVHQLNCRVGTGKSTYHRQLDLTEHEITYGRCMVEDKLASSAAAINWTTGQEIVERGYFAGEISAINLIAHTCCHEFSHVIQSIRGWRSRGGVHNKEFLSNSRSSS